MIFDSGPEAMKQNFKQQLAPHSKAQTINPSPLNPKPLVPECWEEPTQECALA